MSILIPVVYGWEHPSWNTQYYPEDLPAEWKFGYFANEHMGVIVPREVWQNEDWAVIDEWFEDAHDNFAWVIEFDGSVQDQIALHEVFSNYWDAIDALYCAVPSSISEFEGKPIVSESHEQSTSAELIVSDAQTPKEWGNVLKEAAQINASQVLIWVKHAEQKPQVLQDVQTLVGFL